MNAIEAVKHSNPVDFKKIIVSELSARAQAKVHEMRTKIAQEI